MLRNIAIPINPGKALQVRICGLRRGDLRELLPVCIKNRRIDSLLRASTKSLCGSILEPCVENGRQYANDSYYMPNDDVEETRLGVLHQTYLLLLGNQYTTARLPDSIERILDIGAGPGDWALAMAEKYPKAEIIATDICAYLQPTIVPPNLIFQIDDAREEWTYKQPFDIIHIRGLTGAFSNWLHVYRQAFKHLKPGGVLEVVDMGLIQTAEQPAGSPIKVYNEALQLGAQRAGIALGLEHFRRELVEASGLSILRSTTRDVPLGTYSLDPRMKSAGKMALVASLEGLEATALRILTRDLSWKLGEVNDICSKVAKEIAHPDCRAFVRSQFLVARKLLELE